MHDKVENKDIGKGMGLEKRVESKGRSVVMVELNFKALEQLGTTCIEVERLYCLGLIDEATKNNMFNAIEMRVTKIRANTNDLLRSDQENKEIEAITWKST